MKLNTFDFVFNRAERNKWRLYFEFVIMLLLRKGAIVSGDKVHEEKYQRHDSLLISWYKKLFKMLTMTPIDNF